MHDTAEERMQRPKYARFWKADLQMQTPVDRLHWCGETSKLSESPTDAEIAESAKRYAERCFDVGLEIWGLTDHNLGGPLAEDYLGALRQAIDVEADRRRWRPVIFPGFEVEANVGKGLHLLCLFDPATPFDDVQDALTDLGLARNARFASGRPLPLPEAVTLRAVLDRIQGERNGLVIAAHPDGNKGALSDGDLADWLKAGVITNNDLLCMELRSGRDAHATASTVLGAIVRNDPGVWHRDHPIAVVSSSDCKRLDEGDGTGTESWLGRRFCWLKTSDRSIEGMRQSFLDHESRIRFGETRPDDIEGHPRITWIRVEGVEFLVDQEVALSPNLNCFIGGGGTGKSTLLEYCRAALSQTVSDGAGDVSRNHEKLIGSIGSGTVTICVEQGDETVQIEFTRGGPTALDGHGGVIADVEARFPVMVLGQREVYAVAESPKATRAFLDRLQRDRIRELERAEQAARDKVHELDSAFERLQSLEDRLREAQGEKGRFEAALKALQVRQQPLERLDAFRQERNAFQRVEDALEQMAMRLESLASELVLPQEAELDELDTPTADEVSGFDSRARSLVSDVATAVDSQAGKLRSFVSDEQSATTRITWRTEFDRAQAAYEALGGTEDENQLSAEDLRDSIETRQRSAAELAATIKDLHKKEETRPPLVDDLHEVWDAQVAARKAIAARLLELVPKTDTGDPYVTVDVDPYTDGPVLARALYDEIGDKRAFNMDDANTIVDAALLQRTKGESPVLLVSSWLRELQTSGDLAHVRLSQARVEELRRSFPEASIRKLEALRVPDRVVVSLRRQDGSLAGTLDSGLSVGQRCTAILALVLSDGDFPILIDQPEDEIDNEFIYRELVPMLRNAKHRRQIIVSSHDPNLPVNGDAELIYALEARSDGGDVQGGPKTVGGVVAIGSLDRPSVKIAVEEIMEGSEQAFRRRYAKYGF